MDGLQPCAFHLNCIQCHRFAAVPAHFRWWERPQSMKCCTKSQSSATPATCRRADARLVRVCDVWAACGCFTAGHVGDMRQASAHLHPQLPNLKPRVATSRHLEPPRVCMFTAEIQQVTYLEVRGQAQHMQDRASDLSWRRRASCICLQAQWWLSRCGILESVFRSSVTSG